MLRHERQTVAMELAAVLHHSQDARPNGTYEAPRGQKTASSGSRSAPLSEMARPQFEDATLSHRAASALLLAPPSLTSEAAEGVDASAPAFLVCRAFEEEEEEEGQEILAKQHEATLELRSLLDVPSKHRSVFELKSAMESAVSHSSRRKRNKNMKKKLPRSSSFARSARTWKSGHCSTSLAILIRCLGLA